MAKVHPNAAAVVVVPAAEEGLGSGGSAVVGGGVEEQQQQQPTVLTVWRKSLLFNCEGFTVFDARGDLAFRVDCYGHCRRRRRAEDVVLMDAAGTPVLTVRRKRRTIGLAAETWVVYDGDGSETAAAAAKPLLSVRRHAVGLLRRRASDDDKAVVAHVTPLLASSGRSESEGPASYVVEGSYGRRSCSVRDGGSASAEPVAEVRRKEAVGDDVFRLVVAADTRLGAALSMGVVIALDQMFGGGAGSLLLPRRWSSSALH